jgi:phosphoribosyl-ATP pyrophosphohydrolase
MADNSLIIDELFAVIDSRRKADPESSYTAKLFHKGKGKIAQKLGEEAVETIVASLSETPSRVASESADLLYHLLVLWAASGVKPSDVWLELAHRQGTSGIDEKKGRSKK